MTTPTPTLPTRTYLDAAGRRYFLEEVDFLLSFGTSWVTICEQLHRTPGALYRALYRYGRPDLAEALLSAFGREVLRYRTGVRA